MIVFQSYYSLIFNMIKKICIFCFTINFNPIIVLFLTCYDHYQVIDNEFQSYYSLIFNRPHFFSKRAKTIYNLFIHALKFVDYKKCFLFICINKEDKIIENKK